MLIGILLSSRSTERMKRCLPVRDMFRDFQMVPWAALQTNNSHPLSLVILCFPSQPVPNTHCINSHNHILHSNFLFYCKRPNILCIRYTFLNSFRLTLVNQKVVEVLWECFCWRCHGDIHFIHALNERQCASPDRIYYREHCVLVYMANETVKDAHCYQSLTILTP